MVLNQLRPLGHRQEIPAENDSLAAPSYASLFLRLTNTKRDGKRQPTWLKHHDTENNGNGSDPTPRNEQMAYNKIN